MSINRFDAKRDGNEKEIIAVFESFGFSVFRLDTPLDLLVGYNKRNYLVEVKMPGKKLNDNQIEFTEEWKGQFFFCDSTEKAVRFAEEIRKAER